MANGLCDALIAAGITLGGVCVEAPQGDIILPQEDAGVYDHVAPAPKPEPVAKPTAADFPAAIIEVPVEKVVEKVVYRDRPAPKAEVESKTPAPTPELPNLEANLDANLKALELALKYNMALRRAQFTPLEERPLIGSGSGVQSTGAQSVGAQRAATSSGEGFDLPSSEGTDGNKRGSERDVYATYRAGLGLQEQAYEYDGKQSGPPIDNRYILTADRPIPAILETSVSSQVSSGKVFLQTYRDVYSYHGWGKPLIPLGSRLICDYKGPEALGETRIVFKCTRILLAETRRELLINSGIGDVQGKAGLSGEVDNRNLEKYGAAVAMTALGAAIQYAGTKAAEQTTGGGQSAEGQALNSATSDIGEKFGEITSSILEKTIDLKPIVTIAQGTRILLFLEADWYIYERKP